MLAKTGKIKREISISRHLMSKVLPIQRETSIKKLMFHIMRFTISIEITIFIYSLTEFLNTHNADITTFIYSLTKFMNTHNADVKPVNNFH